MKHISLTHLVQKPEGRRERRAALGLGSLRRTAGSRPSFYCSRNGASTAALAVDAPDTDPPGGDLLRDPPDRGPLGDVFGRGREQLELGPHEADQGGQVLRVDRRVEGEGPAADGGDGRRLISRAAGGGGDGGRSGRRLQRIVGGRRRRGGHRGLLVPWVLVGWVLALCGLFLFFYVLPPQRTHTAEQLRREVKIQKRNQKRTLRRPHPQLTNLQREHKKRGNPSQYLWGNSWCQNSASHTVFQRIFTFRKVGIPLFLVSVMLGPYK